MGQTYVHEEMANTLAARDYKQPQLVCFEAKVVLILNDQGGAIMHVEKEDICPTLRAQCGGHLPIVLLGEEDEDEEER